MKLLFILLLATVEVNAADPAKPVPAMSFCPDTSFLRFPEFGDPCGTFAVQPFPMLTPADDLESGFPRALDPGLTALEEEHAAPVTGGSTADPGFASALSRLADCLWFGPAAIAGALLTIAGAIHWGLRQMRTIAERVLSCRSAEVARVAPPVTAHPGVVPRQELPREDSAPAIIPAQVRPDPGRNRVPKIVLAADFLARAVAEFERLFREHGWENEWLVVLVGRVDDAGDFEIVSFIDAGPKAEFSPGHVSIDVEYVDRKLATLRLLHPDLQLLGNLHRHPGAMDTPSGGDRESDRKYARTSHCGGALFGICTVGHPNQNDASSLYHGRFKFDFRYLGEATGYEYEKTLPKISPDLEFQEVSPHLETLLRTRPGLRYDLQLVPLVLPGARLSFLSSGEESVLRCASPDSLGGKELCIVESGGGGALRVIVRHPDTSMAELRGPWQEAGPATPHFYFSEILRIARQQLNGAVNGRETVGRDRFRSGIRNSQ